MEEITRIQAYRNHIGELKAIYTRTKHNNFVVKGSLSAFSYLSKVYDECVDDHEEAKILLLDNSNTVVGLVNLSSGSITGCLVDIRLLFRNAIILNCTSLIFVHNHPSGKLIPSESDKVLTKKIKDAGETLDIKLLDSIIITRKSYFSFADEDLL